MDPVTFTIGGIFLVSSFIPYFYGYKNKKQYNKIKNIKNLADNKVEDDYDSKKDCWLNSGYYTTSGCVSTTNPLDVQIENNSSDNSSNNSSGKFIKYQKDYYDLYNMSGYKNKVDGASIKQQHYSYDEQKYRYSDYFVATSPIKINGIDITQLANKLPEQYIGKHEKYVGHVLPSSSFSDINVNIADGKNSLNVKTTNIEHKFKITKYYGCKNNSFLTIMGYFDKNTVSFANTSDTIITSQTFNQYCDDLKSSYSNTMIVGHVLVAIGIGCLGYSIYNR